MSLEDDKTTLRHRMRTLRAEAEARDPDAAGKLAAIFPMKLLERYGPVVSAYVPINEEIDPMPLLDRLVRAGAETCLPRMTPQGTISWRLWAPGEQLERRGFGLLEPPEDAPEAVPTLVLTPLLAKYLSDEEKRQRRLVHIPMGRFGEAVEIANGALFLASDESSFMTGQSLLVDGGITAAYTTPE
jgi:5-formyltetrahydrofolate cyclo-ligase